MDKLNLGVRLVINDMNTKTEKAPLTGISNIQTVIENIELPYDFKKTAAALDMTSKKTQSHLASKRKYVIINRYASFKSKHLKIS